MHFEAVNSLLVPFLFSKVNPFHSSPLWELYDSKRRTEKIVESA